MVLWTFLHRHVNASNVLLIAAAHESGSGTFETCRAAGTEAQVSPAQEMGADRRDLTERTHSLPTTANRLLPKTAKSAPADWEPRNSNSEKTGITRRGTSK